MFKQSKNSTAQKVGEAVGAASAIAFKKRKKSNTKKKVLGGAVAAGILAVIGGALTKPGPEDRQ
jgi:hypothetical protein